MTKLSVSLPDDLLQDLRAVSPDNVSAFVAAAVRHELDRRRLHAFVEELIEELGPSDEAEVVRYNELFAASAAAARADRKTCVQPPGPMWRKANRCVVTGTSGVFSS